MFSFFHRRKVGWLTVQLNGEQIAEVRLGNAPIEVMSTRQISSGSVILFEDQTGVSHKHELGKVSGWAHFSIRLQANMACQADCAITSSKHFDSNQFQNGDAIGIRFQPFFLSETQIDSESLRGRGLFARGLHFSGTITPTSVQLSCECDSCHVSFLIHSIHAGFSDVAYFYSESGLFTLFVHGTTKGAPAALSDPDPVLLSSLESRLPKAPDGSSFYYKNPFRCPHCKAPYIDFTTHPEERKIEYYGNYFVGSESLYYPPRKE